MHRRGGLREHPALGPLLARRVDLATARSTLDRSAWDAGVVTAASAFERPTGVVGVLQFVVGVVVGIVLAGTGIDSAFLRWGVVVVGAVVAYWLTPTLLAAVAALDAPLKQRDEARAVYEDYRRRAVVSLELRSTADRLADKYVHLRGVVDLPNPDVIREIVTDTVTWLQTLGNDIADRMVAAGVPENEARMYRLRTADDGSVRPPDVVVITQLADINDLLLTLQAYRSNLAHVASGWLQRG
jgi:hypothetical protein